MTKLGFFERSLRAARTFRHEGENLVLGLFEYSKVIAARTHAAWNGEAGDGLIDGTANALNIKPNLREDVQDAALESLKEDLEALGQVWDGAIFYNVSAVRAQAAHKRADAQVAKLSRARDLLLAWIDQNVATGPLGLASRGTQLLLWARDIDSDVWQLCPAGCRHFLIDHQLKGGCLRCACQMAGVADSRVQW